MRRRGNVRNRRSGLTALRGPAAIAVALVVGARTAVGIDAAGWLAAGGVLTYWWSSRRQAAAIESTRLAERRARAEWLHDTVCAEIRVARLKAADPSLDRSGFDRLLGELEHRVRLQQLDDAMDAGFVRLSEIVQPFIRRLQDHGVAVLAAPAFGESRVEVDDVVGRRLRHTLSVLVNNAILAGARGVSLRVALVGSIVEVEVADDAGGFDLCEVPAGRALDMLASEVRSLNVVAATHGEGVVVKVLIDTLSTTR
jgi:hypothetical protein